MTNNLSMIFAADVSGEPPENFSNDHRKYVTFRQLNLGKNYGNSIKNSRLPTRAVESVPEFSDSWIF